MSESLRDKLQSQLGSAYTLERELGGGGMSRVFVAEDNTLGRKIVVKMLPSETAAGVSVERFKREIQVVARLQHPHIVPVLSAGQIDGLPFYTMPFVKGESLRTRLSRSGDMSVNEAVHILRDVAAALAYAHGEGVVHRDIKPDNVMLSGGVAVVTDFGVSKAVDIAATEGDGAQTGLTSLGVALGTPAYMSPEQASADPRTDHRSDIYSFGCLAYELLAGTSPFGGRAPQQILAAHVTEQPEPLLKRRPSIPPALASLVMRCLEKRAGDRPQTADELLVALDSIATTPSGGTAPTIERLQAVGRGRGKWITIAAVVVAITALGLQLVQRFTTTKQLTIGRTDPIAVSAALEGEPAISPDGKLVAFTAAMAEGNRIFVRQIDGGRASLLTGDLEGVHIWPRWSPDGSRISFAADGAIYIVPALTGGAPKRTIENAGTHSWSSDGTQIVYSNGQGIWLQSLSGGEPRRIRAGGFLHSPVLSPDGRVVVYAEGRRANFNNVSTNAIWALPVDGGEPVRVSDSTRVNLSPVWMPHGKSILFISNVGGTRDVYEQPVDGSGRPNGPASRVTSALGSFTITISGDGSRMAYDVVRANSNIWMTNIGASTSMSSSQQITRDNQKIESLGLSPDGKWLAYDSDRSGNFDIYKARLDGGEPVQLTTNTANEFGPSWSRDGQRVAFHSSRSGNRDIYLVSAEGTGETAVTSGPAEDYNASWSPDGRIGHHTENSGELPRVMVANRAGATWTTRPLTNDSLANAFVRWSPDGKLVAFTRRAGIGMADSDGSNVRWLVRGDKLGGQAMSVQWGRDGSTVYAFLNRPRVRAIVAVPVATGIPRVLLEEDANTRFARWEFATDGLRLFFTRAAWESDVWVMELKR
jgi:Tol biopolymer transport system component